MKYLRIVLGCILFSSLSLQVHANGRKKKPNLSAFLRLIQRTVKHRKLPGMAVAVVSKNKVLLARGLGFRNIKRKLKVTPRTLFAIASTTKAFTAASAAILVDQKKLKWDRPIIQYLPSFRLHDRIATQHMTMIDLLSHRSGLPRHDMAWYGSKWTRKKLFERLRYLKANKSFREAWQYQNLMYMVAGHLVGRLSNTTWEKFVRQKIFVPLGMRASNFSAKKSRLSRNYALSYTRTKRGYKARSRHNIRIIGPAGSIHSNVLDMAKWVQLQLNHGRVGRKQVISARAIQQTHTPRMIMSTSAYFPHYSKVPHLSYMSYAMGWIVVRFRDNRLLFHTGGIDGFSALVSFMPERNIGVVLLINSPYEGIIHLMLSCYERLLRYKPSPRNRSYSRFIRKRKRQKRQKHRKFLRTRKRNTHPTHSLSAYVGTYTHPAYGTLKVDRRGRRLRLRFHTLFIRYRHFHDNVFQALNKRGKPRGLQYNMSFHLNAKGKIHKVTLPLQPGVEDIAFIRQN